MTKNGNVYPHSLLVTVDLDGPPWIEPATVAAFMTGGSSTYLNASAADLSVLGLSNNPSDMPGCPDK